MQTAPSATAPSLAGRGRRALSLLGLGLLVPGVAGACPGSFGMLRTRVTTLDAGEALVLHAGLLFGTMLVWGSIRAWREAGKPGGKPAAGLVGTVAFVLGLGWLLTPLYLGIGVNAFEILDRTQGIGSLPLALGTAGLVTVLFGVPSLALAGCLKLLAFLVTRMFSRPDREGVGREPAFLRSSASLLRRSSGGDAGGKQKNVSDSGGGEEPFVPQGLWSCPPIPGMVALGALTVLSFACRLV